MATARDIGKSILAQAPNIAPGASSVVLRKALDLAIDGVSKVPGAKQTAAAALQVFYFVLALINPSGLGLGDVKLSGVLGAFLGWLGWPAVLAGTLAAFVINAAVALALLVGGRVGAKSGIAFGPAMVFGAVAGAAYFTVRTTGLI